MGKTSETTRINRVPAIGAKGKMVCSKCGRLISSSDVVVERGKPICHICIKS